MPRKQPDGNKSKGIARRRDSGGERLRISTSLDFEDAQFVTQVSGSSDSEKLAKIVRAGQARWTEGRRRSSKPWDGKPVHRMAIEQTQSARARFA